MLSFRMIRSGVLLAGLFATLGTALVAADDSERPEPKERPRLKDNEVVSLKSRLEVHGGVSFTIGGGGGGSFREGSAWVSYYDPVTGLGLGFAYSRFSGDGFYGYHPGYYYSDDAYAYSAPPAYFASAGRLGAVPGGFSGDGASLRGAAGRIRPGSGFRR